MRHWVRSWTPEEGRVVTETQATYRWVERCEAEERIADLERQLAELKALVRAHTAARREGLKR